MCSILSESGKVSSSYSITTYEVQVPAADSQTIPTVATGVFMPLYCRSTPPATLTSVIIYYLVVLQIQRGAHEWIQVDTHAEKPRYLTAEPAELSLA